jgi:hypothetical protein
MNAQMFRDLYPTLQIPWKVDHDRELMLRADHVRQVPHQQPVDRGDDGYRQV